MKKGSIYKSDKSRNELLAFHDSMTGNWKFAHEQHEVNTRYGMTSIATAGGKTSPALVLLHGAASNLLGWGGALQAYGQSHFVIAPDIPGEAGKSAPVRLSWDNDEYVQWLDDVLASLGIRECSLMGLSFGGWIAIKYAAHRPQKVNRLVLLTPGGIVPAKALALIRMIWYSMQKQKGAEKLRRMVFGSGEILPEVSRFFDLLQEHYVPRFGSPPLLSDMEIGCIKCPVMMVSGENDAFFHVKKAADRLKNTLPDAFVEIVSKGEHGITGYGGKIAGFLECQLP